MGTHSTTDLRLLYLRNFIYRQYRKKKRIIQVYSNLLSKQSYNQKFKIRVICICSHTNLNLYGGVSFQSWTSLRRKKSFSSSPYLGGLEPWENVRLSKTAHALRARLSDELFPGLPYSHILLISSYLALFYLPGCQIISISSMGAHSAMDSRLLYLWRFLSHQ